jgi:hypothetical protein
LAELLHLLINEDFKVEIPLVRQASLQILNRGFQFFLLLFQHDLLVHEEFALLGEFFLKRNGSIHALKHYLANKLSNLVNVLLEHFVCVLLLVFFSRSLILKELFLVPHHSSIELSTFPTMHQAY